jgi:hypothetical protein
MNIAALLVASLLGGLTNTILSNVPFVNIINCLCCAGFWLGSILAVWIYKRQAGTVTLGQGILVGTLAGLFAGIFGFALSFVGGAGLQALVASYGKYIPGDLDISDTLSGVGSIVANLAGVGVNIVLGAVGGLVGGLIFKSKSS